MISCVLPRRKVHLSPNPSIVNEEVDIGSAQLNSLVVGRHRTKHVAVPMMDWFNTAGGQFRSPKGVLAHQVLHYSLPIRLRDSWDMGAEEAQDLPRPQKPTALAADECG